MAVSVLTEDAAVDALRSFFREKPLLVLGTGMSCALDVRFGMPALQVALVNRLGWGSLPVGPRNQWNAVVEDLRQGQDLESALNNVSDDSLLREIASIAGAFIGEADRDLSCQIAQGEIEWPAIRLLRKLVDGLPEGDRILHVLTPNYDMLFEYACDYAGISYTNGFSGGVERKTDWQAADRSLRLQEVVSYGRRHRRICKYKNHVRIYKVHGSLNYFWYRNAVIENNAWMRDPPDFVERVLITPGLSKYRMLQAYRQELLQPADAAIERATHFLFLGYGFNDSHLEEYVRRKLVSQSCNGLIVTRDSNHRIEALLSEASNLWLVCGTGHDFRNTRIFNGQYSNSLWLAGNRLWDIGEFTTRILGD